MAKIKVSEVFYSLQGEGRFVGVPSVFLRTYGCNFTCAGFGCKPGEKSTGADDVAEVVHHFSDAALRLQPVAMVNADARALIA